MIVEMVILWVMMLL